MADIDNIELRSEKTRQIIGMVPSGIVRYGTLIITIIISILLAVSYFVPYPESLKSTVMVKSTDDEIFICAYIPYSHINSVREGMRAKIEFEGYPASEYGHCTATIRQIDKKVHHYDGANYFVVSLVIDDSKGIQIYHGMSGIANILISNQSILKKLLSIK